MKRIFPIAALLAALLAVPAASADQPRDAWLTAKVKVSLLASSEVPGRAIDVDTLDGRVTLHGTVESEAQKEQAEQRAAAVSGVERVRNLLAVVRPAAAEATAQADEALTDQLETVLARDAALHASDIRVDSVNDGIVVLSGRAETLDAHRRAIEDAESVEGAVLVASQIRSPDERADAEIWAETADGAVDRSLSQSASDAWITTQVKMRLMADPGLSPAAVDVDTRRGVVTLRGVVESEPQRQGALEAARRVTEVRGVVNELEVKPEESS